MNEQHARIVSTIWSLMPMPRCNSCTAGICGTSKRSALSPYGRKGMGQDHGLAVLVSTVGGPCSTHKQMDMLHAYVHACLRM